MLPVCELGSVDPSCSRCGVLPWLPLKPVRPRSGGDFLSKGKPPASLSYRQDRGTITCIDVDGVYKYTYWAAMLSFNWLTVLGMGLSEGERLYM